MYTEVTTDHVKWLTMTLIFIKPIQSQAKYLSYNTAEHHLHRDSHNIHQRKYVNQHINKHLNKIKKKKVNLNAKNVKSISVTIR